jgi:hypothetical protein
MVYFNINSIGCIYVLVLYVLLVYIQVVYLKVKHEILSKNILMQYLNYYCISLIAKYMVRSVSIINSFWIWTQTKTQNKNQFGFELRI